MADTYFVRSRGRISGPFNGEQLNTMARRGQLSRMHELSEDGVTWVAASTHGELFTTTASVNTAAQSAVESTSQPASPAVANEAPKSKDPEWYYAIRGQQLGPVPFTQMQMLAATGQLQRDDRVCSSEMSAWVSAQQVAGLIFPGAVPHAATTDSGQRKTDELPLGLVRSADGSRPWVIFIAVVTLIAAAGSLLAGFQGIIVGGRAHSGLLVALGLLDILWSIVMAVMGVLLLNYASRLGGLRYSPSAKVLEKALDSLRAYWIILAINLIIAITLIVVIMIAAMAGHNPGLSDYF